MELTLEEAIRKSRDMWQWLAENPGKFKDSCPESILPCEKIAHDCYACEMAGESMDVERTASGRNCKKCFLLPLWFGVRSKPMEGKALNEYLRLYAPCEKSEKSPYRKWRESIRRRSRIKFSAKEALRIVKYHDKLLKEIEGGK